MTSTAGSDDPTARMTAAERAHGGMGQQDTVPKLGAWSAAAFQEYVTRVHERTRRVALLIPPGDVEWTPAPGRFTVGDLVRHLAGIERWMYAETVHGRPTRYPGHGPDLAAGFDGVLAYFDRLHAESLALFGALTDERMTGKCRTPTGSEITVWKWLRAHTEHEAHHRGQLYLMLALRGVPTPPIYGLTAEEVQARSRAHTEE